MMLRIPTSVNAFRASRLFGSERRRSSHLAKRDMTSALFGMDEVSFKVRFARETARSSMEGNFSVSGMDAVSVGLDDDVPILRRLAVVAVSG